MKRSEILIALLAAVAVGVVALISTTGDGGDSGDGDGGQAAPAGALRVPFAYSPEKEKLLEPLIRRFNDQGKTAGGKRIFVEGSVVASGAAESQIAGGRLEPVAWSPASSLWGRLL